MYLILNVNGVLVAHLHLLRKYLVLYLFLLKNFALIFFIRAHKQVLVKRKFRCALFKLEYRFYNVFVFLVQVIVVHKCLGLLVMGPVQLCSFLVSIQRLVFKVFLKAFPGLLS